MMVFEVQLAVLKTDHPFEVAVVREEAAASSLAVAQTAALASSSLAEEAVVVEVESGTSLAAACRLAPGASRVVVVVEEVVVVEPFLKSPWLLSHRRIGFRSALMVVEAVEEAEKRWNLILKIGVSPRCWRCPEVVVVGWFVAVEEVAEGRGELGLVLLMEGREVAATWCRPALSWRSLAALVAEVVEGEMEVERCRLQPLYRRHFVAEEVAAVVEELMSRHLLILCLQHHLMSLPLRV